MTDVTTPAEQEAKRRYQARDETKIGVHTVERACFVAGAAFEREQLRGLREAAREYRDARNTWALEEDMNERSLGTALRVEQAETILLAAAAALEEA